MSDNEGIAAWIETLRAAIEAWPGAGATLVVAVSGGSDSVALLHGLALLRDTLGLRLVVAHLDHALRPDSAQDAAWVGHLALALDLPCLRERRDIPALLAREGGNLEEVARCERYAMLEEAARAVRADAIVLAHTADDQAETVLMHLLRGAGLDGLKGMTSRARSPLPDATIPLLRPLLGIERATLQAWLRANDLPWREDPTNQDTARFRSRLRHTLIPLLEREQPHLRAHLARSAQLLAGEHEWLTAETDAAWDTLATTEGQTVRVPRAAFLAQPLALRRRLLRRAFFHLRPATRDLSFEQVEHALALAERGESGARATLPGHLFLLVGRDQLWVGSERPLPDLPTLENAIPLPALGTIKAQGLTVSLQEVGREALPAAWSALPPTVALLDAASIAWPLQLRPPTPGERWAPLGMGGQQVDLRDWLAKHRVPVALRDRVPLLTDARGHLLWIVGWQVGHRARIRSGSERILRVEVEGQAADDRRPTA